MPHTGIVVWGTEIFFGGGICIFLNYKYKNEINSYSFHNLLLSSVCIIRVMNNDSYVLIL